MCPLYVQTPWSFYPIILRSIAFLLCFSSFPILTSNHANTKPELSLLPYWPNTRMFCALEALFTPSPMWKIFMSGWTSIWAHSHFLNLLMKKRYDPREKMTSLTPYTRARRKARRWNETAEISGWLAFGVSSPMIVAFKMSCLLNNCPVLKTTLYYFRLWFCQNLSWRTTNSATVTSLKTLLKQPTCGWVLGITATVTSAKCGNPGLAWQTRQCLSQMARPNMIM